MKIDKNIGITVVVNVVVVLVAAILLKKFISGMVSGAVAKTTDVFDGKETGTNLVISKPTQDGSKTSNIPDKEAETIAEIQYVAMKHLGTDENAIFDSLDGLNGAALKKVVEKFGSRDYQGFGSMPVLGRSKNLFQWYSEELSGKDLQKIKEIFKKSGIKWS